MNAGGGVRLLTHRARAGSSGAETIRVESSRAEPVGGGPGGVGVGGQALSLSSRRAHLGVYDECAEGGARARSNVRPRDVALPPRTGVGDLRADTQRDVINLLLQA